MSLTVQSFDDLTQDQINAAFNLVKQLVQESDPTIDVKRGVIHDLVLYLGAALTATNSANIALIQDSSSIKALSENPTLVDDDVVDNLASNYLVTRRVGTVAQGSVAIILNTSKSIVIPMNSSFSSSGGLEFKADATYTSRTTSGDVAASTDRLLVALGNGTYLFTISVVAAETGSDYRLAVNTSLSPPLVDAAVVSSYVASTFTGGSDDESNTSLIARMSSGVSSKTLATRSGIDGFIKSLDIDTFDNFVATSTVGYSDQEMLRYYSILPVAFGGRTDVYTRTQATIQTQQLTKTATLVDSDGIYGIWQLTFDRDEAPGFYEISRITLPVDINNDSQDSYEITEDVRGYDLTVGDTASTIYLPDIGNALHGTYTRYQTASIKFMDIDTSLSGLTTGTSTQIYALNLEMMPGILDVQDAVSDRSIQLPIADCLIKAPVPCSVAITLNIGKSATSSEPSTVGIQNAVADAVNAINFTGLLPISVVSNAVQPYLLSSQYITSAVLRGRIRQPGGTVSTLTSSSLIDVGNSPTTLVTPKTVAFFLNPSDVAVVISNVDSL